MKALFAALCAKSGCHGAAANVAITMVAGLRRRGGGGNGAASWGWWVAVMDMAVCAVGNRCPLLRRRISAATIGFVMSSAGRGGAVSANAATIGMIGVRKRPLCPSSENR